MMNRTKFGPGPRAFALFFHRDDCITLSRKVHVPNLKMVPQCTFHASAPCENGFRAMQAGKGRRETQAQCVERSWARHGRGRRHLHRGEGASASRWLRNFGVTGWSWVGRVHPLQRPSWGLEVNSGQFCWSRFRLEGKHRFRSSGSGLLQRWSALGSNPLEDNIPQVLHVIPGEPSMLSFSPGCWLASRLLLNLPSNIALGSRSGF